MSGSPFQFQSQLRTHYNEGHDVIVAGPTGGGKTRASLEPGIIGFHQNKLGRTQYPQKILYAIPMRILARSFKDEYAKLAFEKNWEKEWFPRIQTGEQPEDPLFEGKLTFATVDQLLASFLHVPFGLPKRLDNINAGALIGSYLIFDEFHLYPQREMLVSMIAMLKMLKGISRFTLMTATCSPVLLQAISNILDATLIADAPGQPLETGHFADIPALRERERRFYAEDGPLTGEAVLARIGSAQRVLCICNTVDRAQALYQQLADVPDIDCRLLHSRYFRNDRQALETFAIERFKESGARQTILIATQVIEVGLDISSDVMLTECAPAASIIQRAGRCARRKGERGIVYIFQPHDTDEQGELRINYAPYIDDGLEAVCHRTWDALRTHFQGQVMGYPEEQQLVDMAHGALDRELAKMLPTLVEQRIDDITQCITTRDTGYISRLIRQNSSVPLYIHPKPNDDDPLTTRPWERESLSLSKGQLVRMMKSLVASQSDAVIYGGREETEPSDEPLSNTNKQVFRWTPLREERDVYSYWQFTAQPNAVVYTPELGLQIDALNTLNQGGSVIEVSPITPKRPTERIVYHAERYHEHITGLMLAYLYPITFKQNDYRPLREEISYSLQQICVRFGEDFEFAERLIRLTLALHDVGKLNTPWQGWSHAWQAFRLNHGFDVEVSHDDPFPLAHTDYDNNSQEEWDLQRRFKHAPRGNHAVEGAEAVTEIVRAITDDNFFWMTVVLGAIMRHHTPDAGQQCSTFNIVPDYLESFTIAMNSCGFVSDDWAHWLKPHFKYQGEDIEDVVEDLKPNKQNYRTVLMYALFVRLLRLADQRAGRYWERYKHQKEMHVWTEQSYTLKKTPI